MRHFFAHAVFPLDAKVFGRFYMNSGIATLIKIIVLAMLFTFTVSFFSIVSSLLRHQ